MSTEYYKPPLQDQAEIDDNPRQTIAQFEAHSPLSRQPEYGDNTYEAHPQHELHSSSSSKSPKNIPTNEENWQPSYLRRPVLIGFTILLMTSTYNNLTASDLENPDLLPAIAAAIKQQDGIIIAQNTVYGNADSVHPANATNVTLPAGVTGKTDADFIYAGNITVPQGRGLCVAQDATSTHILTGLLGAVLLLFIISWVWMPHTAVLPQKIPLNIASMAALIAGGNLLDYLPPNADRCSDEELKRALASRGDTNVWLGWGAAADVEGRMAGNENEGGVSRFGIWVVERGEVNEAKGERYAMLGR
jgi:hypothetical protein